MGAEDPPYHVPVFVLTHHAREPLAMEGGTTFHFVTDGIESALAQAREAAGGKDIRLGGGAEAARQYLAAGLIDELQLNIVPLLLGEGERLFENVGADLTLAQTRVVHTPEVTHIRYKVEAGSPSVGRTRTHEQQARRRRHPQRGLLHLRRQRGVLLPVAFWLFLVVAILNGIAGSSPFLLLLASVVGIAAGTLYQGMVVNLVRDVQDGRRDSPTAS